MDNPFHCRSSFRNPGCLSEESKGVVYATVVIPLMDVEHEEVGYAASAREEDRCNCFKG